MEVVALADVDPAALEPHRGKEYTLFNSASDMIRSGLIDTLLIVTPHYYHTSIGIEAFQAGLHVMTEKPISVHKADAEKLIAAYEARPHRSQQFGAMFNNRNNATYNKVRDMVASGELGKISRINWIITTWFRPQSYYDRGGWRGTWAGEGGGVLTNQCPHNLDLLQWMLGMMPTTVKAICRLGHSHDIEVEDDVTAILEYANGASGVFVTTTGEAPGTNRLEIVGSRGRLVAETAGIPTPEDPSGGRKDTLIFTRNNTETDAGLRGEGSVGPPEFVEIPVRAPEIADDTEAILSNFFDAIFDPSVKLISHAPEGIKGVELANAMVYAGLTGETVALPMDGSKFEDLLKQLIRQSKKDIQAVVPVPHSLVEDLLVAAAAPATSMDYE
eukprot:COSAG01_NODE_4502_length_4970_cov_587.236707_6_plen_387_part_00